MPSEPGPPRQQRHAHSVWVPDALAVVAEASQAREVRSGAHPHKPLASGVVAEAAVEPQQQRAPSLSLSEFR